MNVLWLTREYTRRTDRGDLLYSEGLIQALAQAGASVTIICAGDRDLASSTPDIQYICVTPALRSRYRSLLSSLPSDAYRLSFSTFADQIRNALGENTYDAVVIDNIAMGWVLPHLPSVRNRGKSPAIIYVAHNFEHSTRFGIAKAYRESAIIRLALCLDAWKYSRLERQLIRCSNAVSAITSADASALAALPSSKHIIVLPPGFAGEPTAALPILEQLPRRCIIVGSFGWIAKQENLRHFLEKAEIPLTSANIELQIVGWAEPEFIAKIRRKFPYVDFVGPVDDVGPYIRGARIGIMPDAIGGGFKLKYLDYIFNGVPFATTDVRMAGLPVEIHNCALAEADLSKLIEAIVSNIDRTDKLDTMRRWAIELCQHKFDWASRGSLLYDTISHFAVSVPSSAGAVTPTVERNASNQSSMPRAMPKSR
jgi:polysaccharide biosynthesis protein PslH